MASQIRRKPQHTYKSPSAGDHSILILSSPSSQIPSTTPLSSSAESHQHIIDLHKRFARRKYPMSPPLPLFHPFGRLAMSLPPLDPTLFGLPTRATPDETFQPKSSSRSRRPTAKLREVDDQQLAPTVSTIAAVAAREVKERPSPRKRRSGAAKRKRKDIDDGDATYPAKRTRIPRGTAGQNVEEDFVEVIPLNGSTLIMPETLSDLVENNNTKRRSARSRASTKRRDSSASETNSISPSTNVFATTSGADTSTNDIDVEVSQESFVVQLDESGEKEEKEEGELSEEQMHVSRGSVNRSDDQLMALIDGCLYMAVFKILPTTQKYDWGRRGRASKVAQFISAVEIDEGSPYAELWMGTHPKSPSLVLNSRQVLSEHLASHPELIGNSVIAKFNAGSLPFLFKVLSIEKALSIQTHPNKEAAEILHAQYPDIYKDPNHKPEMALAITPFEALCGFRPLSEIANFLNNTPELRALIPPSIVNNFLLVSGSNPTDPAEKVALKTLFESLMTTDESIIHHQLDILVKRYQSQVTQENDIVQLVLKLNKQFPGDIGIFCPFLLNYVRLDPGQAIFLGAGEPHAYISGECIECMANSDNVIRAGLTPKLRDIPNLVSNLTYTASPSSKHLVEPKPKSSVSTLYDPPIPEFSVIQVKLPSGEKECHDEIRGPSIAIVTEGKGKVSWGLEGESLDIGLGDVFFVGAGTRIELEANDVGELVIYRAFVEIDEGAAASVH